jgi:hypothetical protein
LSFYEPVLGLTIWRGGGNFDLVLLEESVYFTFDETGIEVTANAAGHATHIHKEAPEGVDDGLCRLGLDPIGPGVAGSVVDEGKCILIPSGTGSLAVPYIHADGVEGMRGALKKLPSVIP